MGKKFLLLSGKYESGDNTTSTNGELQKYLYKVAVPYQAKVQRIT